MGRTYCVIRSNPTDPIEHTEGFALNPESKGRSRGLPQGLEQVARDCVCNIFSREFLTIRT